MDHLAIMNPKWHLIDKILAGTKTIESRWYVHRIAPWNRIEIGETIYFKDAGKNVTAQATVAKVIQKELSSIEAGVELVKEYQYGLCFTKGSLENFDWLNNKKYGILIFLENARKTSPFSINKSGFGSACAWICVENIDTMRYSS